LQLETDCKLKLPHCKLNGATLWLFVERLTEQNAKTSAHPHIKIRETAESLELLTRPVRSELTRMQRLALGMCVFLSLVAK
jgi:hypothetical protein